MSKFLLLLFASCASSYSIFGSFIDSVQKPLVSEETGFGHNELFHPTPEHLLPEKKPFHIDENIHWYERYVNGSNNGAIRRSSCPAVNTLANRGYIKRSGRNVTYSELAHAVRHVWNFGDDNSMLVLAPAFALHGWPKAIDLDWFNDDRVQYQINCPAAPTRNDREVGENVNINRTLYDSLMSYSKDGETLSLEDLAEHHFLRIAQSRSDNPKFIYGNQGAICSLAQYTNMVGVLGRFGKHGRTTLYTEDVKTFYLDEDIPKAYQRRELPYFNPEANAFADRMAFHVGYSIERPFPPGDQDPGRDIAPKVPKFEKNCPGRLDG